MKNEGLRTLTSEKELDLGRKSLGNEGQIESEVLGGEETRSIERDQGRMRENRAKMYIKKIINLDGSRGVVI